MGHTDRVPRYVFPPDMPASVREVVALNVPLAWGVVHQLATAGRELTLRELRDSLGGVDDATLTRRLDALRAARLVHANPPDRRQGHTVRYRHDHERLDALVVEWSAYVRGH